MNVGQIKRALEKFGPDMETAEVAMIYVLPNGVRRIENAIGVGFVPVDDTCLVAFCGETYIKEQVESGKMPKPERYDETMAEWEKTITNETNGQ